ncbi:MAG: hypothetical protein K2J61_04265, partial [Clostridia bacterium]|nr:hypothetical protein [Clostridia bacterium]
FDGDYTKLAKNALGLKEAWGVDMNTLHADITATVAKYLQAMDTKGMRAAVECFTNGCTGACK